MYDLLLDCILGPFNHQITRHTFVQHVIALSPSREDHKDRRLGNKIGRVFLH